MAFLPHTQHEIGAHLPRYLAALAVRFMAAASRDAGRRGLAGEWESAAQDYDFLEGAARGGHVHIVKRFASGIDAWAQSLLGACRGGHVRVAHLALHHGGFEDVLTCEACTQQMCTADHAYLSMSWNNALALACVCSHVAIVRLLLPKYPQSQWAEFANQFLFLACRGGSVEAIELLVARGAKDFDLALENACTHGELDAARMMITLGATNVNDCLQHAAFSGDLPTVKLLVEHGATAFESGIAAARARGKPDILQYLLEQTKK